MLCQILKPFVYSSDGVTPKQAVPGRPCIIPADLVAGLQADGYIRPKADEAKPEPVKTTSRRKGK